ncbi:hypothetical protein KC338_g60 [Hortaea werneckii]|nr:hypothetical protein KC338_g60 [Hortaea werneckii]
MLDWEVFLLRVHSLIALIVILPIIILFLTTIIIIILSVLPIIITLLIIIFRPSMFFLSFLTTCPSHSTLNRLPLPGNVAEPWRWWSIIIVLAPWMPCDGRGASQGIPKRWRERLADGPRND